MIQVCIEAEADSCEKNLYDERTLEYKGARRISRRYPYPYGFIIGTRAADGDNVDCYLITHERLRTGTIVECEPIGLLEQDEDGEVDHKVLAALPGQAVEVGPGLQQELRDFIVAGFAQFPEVCVRVGAYCRARQRCSTFKSAALQRKKQALEASAVPCDDGHDEANSTAKTSATRKAKQALERKGFGSKQASERLLHMALALKVKCIVC